MLFGPTFKAPVKKECQIQLLISQPSTEVKTTGKPWTHEGEWARWIWISRGSFWRTGYTKGDPSLISDIGSAVSLQIVCYYSILHKRELCHWSCQKGSSPEWVLEVVPCLGTPDHTVQRSSVHSRAGRAVLLGMPDCRTYIRCRAYCFT